MKKSAIGFICLLTLSVFVVGCAPQQYVPSEYAIDRKRIPELEIKGSIRVESVGASTDVIKVYKKEDRDVSVDTTYKLMTDALVKQLKVEMFKRGGEISENGYKSFKVTVTHAEATSSLLSFKSTMKVTVVLGNGITQKYEVHNTSTGSVPRTLNGAIARAVINILKNETVLEYLKS